MVSLTLWPLAPWHAAHTVAALALPASISAACANGATARTTDNPSAFFMGLLPSVAIQPIAYLRCHPVGQLRAVIYCARRHVARVQIQGEQHDENTSNRARRRDPRRMLHGGNGADPARAGDHREGGRQRAHLEIHRG